MSLSRARSPHLFSDAALLNHPTGYHGIERFNNDDSTRAVIDQTLAFVRQATSRPYQHAALASLRSIPSRFLPRSVADDSAFTSMRGRPEFHAIFSVPPG